MIFARRLVLLAAAATVVAVGCGVRQRSILLPNQAPEVELFTQRVDASVAGPIAYKFSWAAHDPDGRVDHYLYSFGSPGEDDARRNWVATTENQQVLGFARSVAPGDSAARGAVEPRVFTLQAVDGAGARSISKKVALFEDNVAPYVLIVSPRPTPLTRTYVTPTVCIEWHGGDVDGIYSKLPIKYKYKLLTSTTEVPISVALTYPDSVRRYYAPRKWAGWDSCLGSKTGVVLNDLIPENDYVFVVTCFDEMRDYDPVFALDKNMLWMRAAYAGSALPKLTMFNEWFYYTYPVGKFDPTPAITFEAPGGQPFTFNWAAEAMPGNTITAYRWALDIADPNDETPRSNESTDLRHWSVWSLWTTSATLPPFNPIGGQSETHDFFVEARQAVGCGSTWLPALGVARFTVVNPTFDKALLVVNDTRFPVDELQPGTNCYSPLNRPKGAWPTSAEFDTFLFARGGVPWRCYPPTPTSPPSYFGGNSSRGIFYGYDFDTLGTRLGVANMTVPLSTLGHYAHVVWLVDAVGATKFKPGTDRNDPTTALRYMCASGHSNTLAAYIRGGGKVWLAGGGAVAASLEPWNVGANDAGGKTYSFTHNELVPGRFVYDQFHWRSEVKPRTGAYSIVRNLGRFESSPPPYSTALLPAAMQPKAMPYDTFPPNRSYNPGDFYTTLFAVEYLSQPNDIQEDYSPDGSDYRSTLDTLYVATGSGLPTGPNPVMTYYHGLDNGPVVLTGFSLWSFRKYQCESLVDFVLQTLWGLQPYLTAPGAVTQQRPGGRQIDPNMAARRVWAPRATPRE